MNIKEQIDGQEDSTVVNRGNCFAGRQPLVLFTPNMLLEPRKMSQTLVSLCNLSYKRNGHPSFVQDQPTIS